MTLIVLFFSWQKIERKVVLNTQQSLGQQYAWSKVENFNRGRDVLLTGTAPNQEAADQAVAVAESTPGVRSVQFVGELAPVLKPARISIQFKDGNIIFGGIVNNTSSRKSIIDNARVQFKKRPVLDKIQTGSDIASAPDISSLLAAASLLKDGAEVLIDGDKLNVQAEVNSEIQAKNLNTRFARAFLGSFESNISVNVHQVCLSKLNNLVAESSIHFDIGASTIQAKIIAVIDAIFATISGCPDIEMQINGHTDNTGSSAKNLALSLERAQSVVAQLIDRGLKPSQFLAQGYGAEQPIESNDTAEGRAANRRIEFKLK